MCLCAGCSSEPAFSVLQEMLMLTFASGAKMCKSDCSSICLNLNDTAMRLFADNLEV